MDRLEAMKAFVRLVELGNFSKVATEIRVKQSTVSKWIANLETQLQTQLLERTSRTLRVTEPGQFFYERAKEILATYEATELQLQQTSPALRGLLRISVPVVFGRLFILPHIVCFAQMHQELEIEILFDDRYVRMPEERFDVAIRVGLPVDSSLRSRTLARTPRYVVASPTYLEAYGIPQTPKELKEHNCLLHSSLKTSAIWKFYRDGKTTRAAVSGRLMANNSEAILSMAEQGLGIGLLASWLVEAALMQGTLVTLLNEYEAPPAPIQALTAPGRYMHPRVRVFLDFMTDALKGMH